MDGTRASSLREDLARRGPLAEGEVLALGVRLARELASLHARGVAHGAVTPATVSLAVDGSPTLAPPPAAPAGPLSVEWLGYLPPEVALGSAPDPRSDVYQAGLVLQEVATGLRPHASAQAASEVTRVLVEPPFPDPPAVGPALAALLRRCQERDPSRRPRDGAALLRELEEVRDTEAPAVRGGGPAAALRWALLGAAAAGLALCAATLMWPAATVRLRWLRHEPSGTSVAGEAPGVARLSWTLSRDRRDLAAGVAATDPEGAFLVDLRGLPPGGPYVLTFKAGAPLGKVGFRVPLP